MIVIVMTMSSENHDIVTDPEIITRGFVYVKESEALLEELHRVILESLKSCRIRRVRDWASIKSRVKADVSGYLYKHTRRSPMILPVIIEV